MNHKWPTSLFKKIGWKLGLHHDFEGLSGHQLVLVDLNEIAARVEH